MVLLLLPLPCMAQEQGAKEISSVKLVTDRKNFPYPAWLFNGDRITFQTCKGGSSLTLSSQEGIGSLAILFNRSHAPYWIRNEETGEEKICGEENFLHDFVDVKAMFGTPLTSLTVTFPGDPVQLTELRVFTEGEVPKDVQRWKTAPDDGVDLLVFPAHGDDEQLFFAGLLPYYAGELGYEVQVAYSTDHHNYNSVRPHEMLNGLWAVGVRNYPVFGPFPDYYSESEDQAVRSIQPAEFQREDVKAYVTEQIRRFKPLVVVGHDLNGEYGHGFHRLYGHVVQECVDESVDYRLYPESSEKYGVWDVPKTYSHLYQEHPVHMNWDVPLKNFDGMTAYQVTKQYGYPAHRSQYSGFAWYFADHDTAESIRKFSPCDYGLYRSTVGEDVQKNDLFENLTDRKQMKLLEEERRLREEKEAADRAQRAKEEKQKKAREAMELARRERADRKAQEEIAGEALRLRQNTREFFGYLLAGVLSFIGLLLFLTVRIGKRKKEK